MRCAAVGSTSQALAYLYSRDNPTEALQAKMLIKDEARRSAINIARRPELLGKAERDSTARPATAVPPRSASGRN
jgi:hypothetical protein